VVNNALDRLAELPLGTRMVVRYRIDGGLTDALGDLTARDSRGCTITTRMGPVIIRYDDVTLAKPVPPPPARRERAAP
jgi:hypothetical protein